MRVVFHVGFHRTGTTWLQQVLLPEHPALAPLCDSRRPWDDPLLRALVLGEDVDQASGLLRARIDAARAVGGGEPATAVVSAERLCGHPLSGGHDQGAIAERLARVCPEAHVLVVVRNQPDALWSVHRQLVKGGYPGSFARLLADGDEPGWKTPGFRLDFYAYDRLVDTYRSLLGRERVHVLAYEDLDERPARFLRDLCVDVLGVEESPALLERAGTVMNRGLDARRVEARRRLNHLRRSAAHPFPLVTPPERVLTRLEGALATVLRAPEEMAPDTRHRLAARFHDANERLRALVPGHRLERFTARLADVGGRPAAGSRP